MKKKLNGFTLSETLIVVVVLGIIATLTIPALVNKNKESVAKTKVRKAMAAYESALNKMIIENDLKDNGPLNDWAGAVDNCGNPTQYFKKTQDVNGCIFKTSDGVWWNISDIERPLIAFKQDDLTEDKANDQNDYSAFVLVGRFGNDGSLRVDDLAYETANSIADANGNESKAQVEKLYNLLGMKKANTQETCDIICQSKRGDSIPICTDELKNCATACADSGDSTCYLYDNSGNKVATINTNVWSYSGKDYVSKIFIYNDGSQYDTLMLNNGNILETNLYTTDGIRMRKTYIIDDSGNSVLECEYNQDYNTHTATVVYGGNQCGSDPEW